MYCERIPPSINRYSLNDNGISKKQNDPHIKRVILFPDLTTAGANSTTNAHVSAAADGKSRTP